MAGHRKMGSRSVPGRNVGLLVPKVNTRPHLLSLEAQAPELGQGAGARAFCELAAVGAGQEPMMTIDRRGQAEEDLKEAVQPRRRVEVPAADDVRDALARVVDHAGEVVARGDILAHDDGVAPGGGVRLDGLGVTVLAELGEGDAACSCLGLQPVEGAVHIEAQGERLIARNPPGDLLLREMLVQAGIERGAVGIARFGRAPRGFADFGAGGEAGIEQPQLEKRVRGGLVCREMLALAQDGLFPAETEPGEILEDPGDMHFAGAREVDVLDAHEKAPAEALGHVEVQQRRKRMAKVQRTVRTWREAEDGPRRTARGLAGLRPSRQVRGPPAPCVPFQSHGGEPTLEDRGRKAWSVDLVQGNGRPKSKRRGVAALKSARDIRAGARALRTLCPVMRRVHDLIGDPPLRRHPPGFEGLARIVVGQQLSMASAAAIWQRTAAAVVPFDADTFLAQDDATLRRAGLSQGKVKTLRAVAHAIQSGELSLDAELPDIELAEALHRIRGIGPWTADIYMLFCLGRTDGFAAGDLALQVAVQRAFALDTRPSAPALAEIAERWRPWRGVAAHLLWAFYAQPPRAG